MNTELMLHTSIRSHSSVQPHAAEVFSPTLRHRGDQCEGAVEQMAGKSQHRKQETTHLNLKKKLIRRRQGFYIIHMAGNFILDLEWNLKKKNSCETFVKLSPSFDKVISDPCYCWYCNYYMCVFGCAIYFMWIMFLSVYVSQWGFQKLINKFK